MYLLFGRNRFHGYTEAHRKIYLEFKDHIQQIYSQLNHFQWKYSDLFLPIQNLAREIQGVGFLSGNDATILFNGQDTYDTMYEKILTAKEYICLQTYIYRPDEIGNKFKKILIEKAQAGVRVYFLYDEIGCYYLKDEYLQDMIDAGILVSAFQTTRGRGNRFQVNFRNHRKVLIVDGKYGFVGGLNFGKEYLGGSKRYPYWRDTHLLMEGPLVQCMQISFAKDWYWATHNFLELNWTVNPAPRNAGFLLLPSGPADIMPTASLMMLNLIVRARRRLWITSPYFIPDESILNALHLAALRGVDVRILLPARYDKFVVYLCSFTYYDDLKNYNIRVFRCRDTFVHQKVILVDDLIAGIGTVNLDNRSLYINFEITALSVDERFILDVEEMLNEDFAKSYEVDLDGFKRRNLGFRMMARAVRLFSPLL